MMKSAQLTNTAIEDREIVIDDFIFAKIYEDARKKLKNSSLVF